MTELVVEKDMVASVHYTGTFPEDGEEFDSSKGSEPLSFLVGHKQMIPGFEREMMGATVGEKRTFTLPPEDAYGQPSDENVVELAKEILPGLDKRTSGELRKQLTKRGVDFKLSTSVTEIKDSKVVFSDEENAENSPKIKKKPLIRKRKKMTITMEDLENAKESDEDKDFVV